MRARRLIAGIATTILVASGLSLVQGAAPAGAIQGPLPSTVAPTWQTNAPVRAIAVVGGIVYIGGNFTSVRLPGRPIGSGEIARSHLAAFNASTGHGSRSRRKRPTSSPAKCCASAALPPFPQTRTR